MKLKNVNKKMLIIILIILLITIFAICLSSTYLINVINNAKKEQSVGEFFSYIVYDNQNEEEIKVLVKINSENGIESVESPDGNQILANGKKNVAIDCKIKKDEEKIFKIKEVGKEEVERKLHVTDDVLDGEISINILSEIIGYKTIEIVDNIPLEGYNKIQYKIGKNGTWQEGIGKMPLVDYDLTRNELINEDGTVTISVKAENSKTSNIIQHSKDLKIKSTSVTESIEAESLIEAMSRENIETGKYEITVSDETYNVQVYEFHENMTIDMSTEFGTEEDVATATEYAKNMIAIKVNGDLNINEGATLTPHASKNGYGGPKGIFIYCTGTLTNNGTITMTARGAKAEGQNVYLFKNNDNTYEYVPKEGGAGGTSVSSGSGIKGEDGVGRQTGGGGSGGSNFGRVSGAGAKGTSYSGGTSGAGSSSVDGAGHFIGTSGSENGGAGGIGRYNAYQGVGNPSGGTAGLIIIYADNIINNNQITSVGTMPGHHYDSRTAGGSSGGGSINIFYKNTFQNTKDIIVNGGTSLYGMSTGGGAGGKGTVSLGSIATGKYISDFGTLNLKERTIELIRILNDEEVVGNGG